MTDEGTLPALVEAFNGHELDRIMGFRIRRKDSYWKIVA
jgi:hypothetical protein